MVVHIYQDDFTGTGVINSIALLQKRRNSIANALGLRLFRIKRLKMIHWC